MAAFYKCGSIIHNLPYEDWTAEFWRWVHSIPQKHHPSIGSNCEKCASHQTDPNVWFLTGSRTPSHQRRKCTIRGRKDILVPVINSDPSFAEFPHLKTESQLLNHARSEIDTVDTTKLAVTIDGKSLDSSAICRAVSIFDVRFVKNDIYGSKVRAGPSKAVSDGYWVFLRPLSKGKHSMRFKATGKGIGNEVSYDILVA